MRARNGRESSGWQTREPGWMMGEKKTASERERKRGRRDEEREEAKTNG